jgi:demethylsterigmatocystin 6-O-methyltransferase
MQAFPDYLKETNYQDITDPVHTVHQKAFNTELSAFLWYQTKPDLFAHFSRYMAAQHLGLPSWLDVYPWKEKIEGLKPGQPFFVDVGGGIGHQSIALREKVPELPNRIIVQDVPATLKHAIKHPSVETMVQDFWEPQSVKGEEFFVQLKCCSISQRLKSNRFRN